MRLIELYDNPLDYEDHEDPEDDLHDTYENVRKRFRTKNGQVVTVNFEHLGETTYDLRFDVDGSMGMTGKGETVEIFSTVLAIVIEFVDDHPNSVIYFTADGESRIRLYSRLLDTYLSAEYTVVKNQTTKSSASFEIRKDSVYETSLNELFNTPTEWEDDTESEEEEELSVKFNTNNGQTVYVNLGTDIMSDHENDYHLQFHTKDNGRPDFYKSGKGEQGQIFSTVIAIVAKFLTTHPDASIRFTASEQNRSKLYSRMLKRVLSSRYSVDVGEDLVGNTEFKIMKRQQ